MSKKELMVQAFEKLWKDIFSSSMHLDSALSKQDKSIKTVLARVTPRILMRPTSVAENLGVGVGRGEPWSLTLQEMSNWRAAVLMAQRMMNQLDEPTAGDLSKPGIEDFPPSMREEWERDWGPHVAQELVMALGREAPLSLRAVRKIGAAALLKELKEEIGLPVPAKVSELAPLGVRLEGYVSVLNSKLSEEGMFEIQDEGSQFMSLFALWPELYGKFLQSTPGNWKVQPMPAPPENPPAWTVIDACAGAGGKSLALGDALQGKGRVFAYDTVASKLSALKRRASRSGLRSIQTVAVEEGKEKEVVGKFRRRANVVLVDAPCSGWGVLRRNPDIKWRQSSDTLTRMPLIQLRLLTEYADLVAAGGKLVFGVCTFRKSETVEVVEKFLASNPDFESQAGGFLGPNPCDGFYMHSMTRK